MKRIPKTRWRFLAVVLALVLLLTASRSLAQSGTTSANDQKSSDLRLSDLRSSLSTGYDLTWSTVDGGGHTWSTGNGYSLGGAVGQADAQVPASGSGYALQGGFWHKHCAPVVVAVDITCLGTQAQLTWMPDAANMAYDIYRDTGPYFIPDPTLKVGTDSDGLWLDTPDTCGDVASNYYYQVRSTCIGAHADANPCAEFDFGLVPGSS